MLVKTVEITSKCSNFKLNKEPAQILDCVTSMVYKCIDNEKLFSFFFNFYGKSINNWYEEEESEFCGFIVSLGCGFEFRCLI